MESAFGLQLKKYLVRAGLYALGLAVILALAGAVGFSLLKPKILLLVQAEMRKYGVKAQNIDMSMFGTVHMSHMVMPLASGGMVRIDAVAARPPLYFWGQTWLGSQGALYNMRLEKGGLRLTVPEMRFSGLALAAKDPAVTSHGLQILQRLAVRRLQADEIRLAAGQTPVAAGAAGQAKAAAAMRLQTILRDFTISGLARGQIEAVSYDSMRSDTAAPAAAKPPEPGRAAAAAAPPERQAKVESGAFSAENVDAAALYALAKNLLPPAKAGQAPPPLPAEARRLIGKIRLDNVSVRAEDGKAFLRLTAGELASNGFALKGGLTPAAFITRLPDAAPGERAAAEKQFVLHNMRQVLADIAAVDIAMDNVQAEVKSGAPAEAAAAARPAGQEKTVSDIIDEEQAAGRPGLHLPADFRLGVKAFALTADNWQQAVPYRFYIKLKDLVYRPEGETQANSGLLSLLRADGQQDLHISLLGDIAWEAADSSLNIRRLAFYGRDLGGFDMQGKLLDIPAAVFAAKPAAVNTILNEAAIASLEIRLQDSGFIHNLVQWGTRQINISAEELQTDLHDIMVKSPPLLLKNSREAQNFSDVFGAFIAHSGTVRITMTAPQAGGLKVHDILSAQDDLPALLGKLQLTADTGEADLVIE